MSNLMIPVIQYHHCKKCNDTHEYVIDKNFLLKLKQHNTPLKVRCAVCGEVRKRVNQEEKNHLDGKRKRK